MRLFRPSVLVVLAGAIALPACDDKPTGPSEGGSFAPLALVESWSPGSPVVDNYGRIPAEFAVSPEGTLLFPSYTHKVIHEVDRGGSYLSSWSVEVDGQPIRPTYVHVGPDGRYYLRASGFATTSRIVVLDSGRRVERWFQEQVDTQVGNWTRGLAVAPTGEIFSANAGEFEIQKYSAEGVLVLRWGREGSGPGEFGGRFGIIGLAIDPSGRLLVADVWNDRIQIFDSEGRFVGEIGSGDGPGRLQMPTGLAIDPDGVVHVVDSGNERLARFRPDGSFLDAVPASLVPDPGWQYDPLPFTIGVRSPDVFVAHPNVAVVERFGRR